MTSHTTPNSLLTRLAPATAWIAMYVVLLVVLIA